MLSLPPATNSFDERPSRCGVRRPNPAAVTPKTTIAAMTRRGDRTAISATRLTPQRYGSVSRVRRDGAVPGDTRCDGSLCYRAGHRRSDRAVEDARHDVVGRQLIRRDDG